VLFRSRQPNDKEMKQTSVLEFAIEEASAKVRVGGPIDDEEDYALPVWAGVLPLRMETGEPVGDVRLLKEDLPEYVVQYDRNKINASS